MTTAHTVYWKIQTTVQHKKYLRKYLKQLFFQLKLHTKTARKNWTAN